MKLICALATCVGILSAGNLAAQEAPQATPESASKPVRLTAEMRTKLTERREKVAQDQQYLALQRAARQAQARADDYFLAKLREAVADDKNLEKYVRDLIRQQKSLQGGEGTQTEVQ